MLGLMVVTQCTVEYKLYLLTYRCNFALVLVPIARGNFDCPCFELLTNLVFGKLRISLFKMLFNLDSVCHDRVGGILKETTLRIIFNLRSL